VRVVIIMNKEKKKVSRKDVAILFLWDDGVVASSGVGSGLRYGSDYLLIVPYYISHNATIQWGSLLRQPVSKYTQIMAAHLFDTSRKTWGLDSLH